MSILTKVHRDSLKMDLHVFRWQSQGKFPLCSISISSVAQMVDHGTSDIKVMGLNTREYTKLLQLELEDALNNKIFKLHICKCSFVSSSHTL